MKYYGAQQITPEDEAKLAEAMYLQKYREHLEKQIADARSEEASK